MDTINWAESMQRSYEYYIVDPNTWRDIRPLRLVKRSAVDWDSDADTLGSATFDMDEDIGEQYVRIYMIVIQNGVKHRLEQGTFLIQTPSLSDDGKVTSVTADAYTPLIELTEKHLPIGYCARRDTNIMDLAYNLVREGARAPVVKTECTEILHDDFTADPDDTYLTFIRDLISNAKYELGLDERGRILFIPKRDTAALRPVKTFNDSNSSIVLPGIDVDTDIYKIPNVVNVVYSNGSKVFNVTVKNEDNSSPTSIQARGREIQHRVVNPTLLGDADDDGVRVREYAEQLLKELSSVERTVMFTHAYCDVKNGDCVRLDFSNPNIKLHDVKARIINQSISHTPDCPVTTTAVYTHKYWR